VRHINKGCPDAQSLFGAAQFIAAAWVHAALTALSQLA
jgi:hypothetical protein